MRMAANEKAQWGMRRIYLGISAKKGDKCLFFYFGILQFGKCWELISQPVELVEFIKQRSPSTMNRLGVAYVADSSRHPV